MLNQILTAIRNYYIAKTANAYYYSSSITSYYYMAGEVFYILSSLDYPWISNNMTFDSFCNQHTLSVSNPVNYIFTIPLKRQPQEDERLILCRELARRLSGNRQMELSEFIKRFRISLIGDELIIGAKREYLKSE